MNNIIELKLAKKNCDKAKELYENNRTKFNDSVHSYDEACGALGRLNDALKIQQRAHDRLRHDRDRIWKECSEARYHLNNMIESFGENSLECDSANTAYIRTCNTRDDICAQFDAIRIQNNDSRVASRNARRLCMAVADEYNRLRKARDVTRSAYEMAKEDYIRLADSFSDNEGGDEDVDEDVE